MSQQLSVYDVNNLTIPTIGLSSYITITTSLVFTTTLLASYFICIPMSMVRLFTCKSEWDF